MNSISFRGGTLYTASMKNLGKKVCENRLVQSAKNIPTSTALLTIGTILLGFLAAFAAQKNSSAGFTPLKESDTQANAITKALRLKG